jgi:nucleoside-diphosphate-sugar epimerase
MKILLTGASGFLGKYISNSLNRLGYAVDTIGRSPEDNIQIDLCFLKESIDIRYDVIIHVAAKAHIIPRNVDEERMFYEVNLKGTRNLLKSLAHSPKYFVFISTVSVYGILQGLNIDESYPRNAEDPYGKSKILAEEELEKWSLKENVTTTILRLPLLIGHDPKGNLQTIINAIKRGYYLNIGKGEAKKSMVLAEDVADFIPKAMIYGGIYNLTDGYHPSFKEISDAISTHFSAKKVKHVSPFIIKSIALIGSFIEFIFKIRMPINRLKYEKMTKSLTFNDHRAKEIGWKPREVLKNTDLWL